MQRQRVPKRARYSGSFETGLIKTRRSYTAGGTKKLFVPAGGLGRHGQYNGSSNNRIPGKFMVRGIFQKGFPGINSSPEGYISSPGSVVSTNPSAGRNNPASRGHSVLPRFSLSAASASPRFRRAA